jgi:hypothetical protein
MHVIKQRVDNRNIGTKTTNLGTIKNSEYSPRRNISLTPCTTNSGKADDEYLNVR